MFPVAAPPPPPPPSAPVPSCGGWGGNNTGWALPLQGGNGEIVFRGPSTRLMRASRLSLVLCTSPKPYHHLHPKAIISFRRTVVWNSKEVSGICKTTGRFEILIQSTDECGTVRDHMNVQAQSPTHWATGGRFLKVLSHCDSSYFPYNGS